MVAKVKTSDPAEIKLRDEVDALRRKFERAYARMRRAVNAMETARKKIVRLEKKLENGDW